jgi:UDP-sulfoquinovose synthase
MRIMALGGDGYLGWPTVLHLSTAGHDVMVLDNLRRRDIDRELGIQSLTSIAPLGTRAEVWQHLTGRPLACRIGDVLDHQVLVNELREFQPDAVVHLAEVRSAPYSMIDAEHALDTQRVNVLGTLGLIYAVAEVDPTIHIVKLGSMGEYGTPNLDIEEGWLDIEHNGRRDRVLYPKRPGSWYHLSKVHDSHNLEFAARAWGLRVTDLNQGVVYGHRTAQTDLDYRLGTRLDYDAVYGTVLNRFAVQAATGHPLTVYGDGSQTRGVIALRDAVRCIELACLHPAESGEFRVFNQLAETFSVLELAEMVARVAGRPVEVRHLDNPRVEQEGHHYRVTHTGLPELGLEPHPLGAEVIGELIDAADRHRDRVSVAQFEPRISWRPRRIVS